MVEIPEELKGHIKFRKAIMNTLKPVFEKTLTENRRELGQVSRNILFNEVGPKKLDRTLSKNEKVFSVILEGYFEIERAYSSLNELPLFIGQFPKNLPRKSKYLELIITNYLNEVYILSKRLEAYRTKISRLYRNNANFKSQQGLLKSLSEELTKIFKIINKTRSNHVHESRFSDIDLDRLIYLELFIDDASMGKLFISTYKKALKENKKKWQDYFNDRNNEMQKILDIYFQILYMVIFDEKESLIYPNL